MHCSGIKYLYGIKILCRFVCYLLVEGEEGEIIGVKLKSKFDVF